MKWKTKSVSTKGVLSQTKVGQQKMIQINADTEVGGSSTVLPILDNVTWYKNLYNMLWQDDLRDDLYLNIEVFVNDDINPDGVATLKINNADGTVKYGSYDIPIQSMDGGSHYQDNYGSGYSLVFLINEPKETAKKPNPFFQKFKLSRLSVSKPPEEEKRMLSSFNGSEQMQRSPVPTKPSPYGLDDEEPFILNTDSQHDGKQFVEDELIVFYIDSARYLPENTSISRVVFRAVNDDGSVVIKPELAAFNLELSTAQKPFFGLRYEITKKK